MKKSISLFLSFILLLSLFSTNAYAVTYPEIYRDEINVKVGETVTVDFTYGDSSNRAEIVSSNLKVEVTISGNKLNIKGITEGNSYITLQFSDGSNDTLKVIVTDKYGNHNGNSENNIEIIKGDNYNLYIDLDKYNADRATISVDNSCISVNRSSISSSNSLKITGNRVGTAELKVKYDTNDIDIYYIDVVSQSVNSDKNFNIGIKDTVSYYIDLEDYSSCNIKYDSDYISINKNYFSSSGYLKITGEYEGRTEVKLTYNNGDVYYLVVNIDTVNDYENPYVSVSDLKLEKNESVYFNAYLKDSDFADISVVNTNCVTVSNDYISRDSKIKVTAKNIGETTIKVEFSDNTKVYITVKVVASTTEKPTAELSRNKVKLNDTVVLDLYTGTQSNSVTITFKSPENLKINVSNYSKYQKSYTIPLGKKVHKSYEIEAIKLIENTEIDVKFSNGETYNFKLSVVEKVNEKAGGVSKTGEYYLMNEYIYPDTNVLGVGYITGFGDGTFKPNNVITREEFGVMLARLLKSDKNLTSSDYLEDVTAQWSKDSIAKLVSLDIVPEKVLYRPSEYITRNEVIEMLYNVVNLSGYSEYCKLSDVDYSSLGRKIAQCYNSGILTGYSDGTFGGTRTIVRAEAVTILNRIFYEDLKTDKVLNFSDVPLNYWAYSQILKATSR